MSVKDQWLHWNQPSLHMACHTLKILGMWLMSQATQYQAQCIQGLNVNLSARVLSSQVNLELGL